MTKCFNKECECYRNSENNRCTTWVNVTECADYESYEDYMNNTKKKEKEEEQFLRCNIQDCENYDSALNNHCSYYIDVKACFLYGERNDCLESKLKCRCTGCKSFNTSKDNCCDKVSNVIKCEEYCLHCTDEGWEIKPLVNVGDIITIEEPFITEPQFAKVIEIYSVYSTDIVKSDLLYKYLVQPLNQKLASRVVEEREIKGILKPIKQREKGVTNKQNETE